MRLAKLGAIAALGAMLAMPVLAQTTTSTPAVRPPAAAMPPAMPSAMPPATAPAAGTMTTAPAKPMAKPAAAPAAMAAPVNINTATAKELDKVKYIGPKRAAKIIAGRPWTTTDDLVAKKVLPKSVLDKIRDKLTTS